MTEQEAFIKILSTLLEEKNITQRELADKINVTEVTISRYLSGERSPRIEIVNKIAEYFDVSIDYLLGRVDTKTSNSTSNENGLVIGLSRENKGILTDEDKEEITRFAEYVANRRKGEK